MDHYPRAIGEHLHQVIVLSEAYKKELAASEGRALEAADLQVTLEALRKQVSELSAEVARLEAKRQEFEKYIAGVRAKFQE